MAPLPIARKQVADRVKSEYESICIVMNVQICKNRIFMNVQICENRIVMNVQLYKTAFL